MTAHNALIHTINERLARSFAYRGLVIDLGCGSAPYRSLVLEQADKYVGVDWPTGRHDASRVDVMADVSSELPFATACADVIVLFQTLEHLQDPRSCLLECRRLLRSTGRLYVTVPFMWHVHEAPHDYFRFTRHGLAHLLQTAGFRDVEIKETTGFWQMVVLKLNYHLYPRLARWMRPLFVPFWWFGQKIAPFLDRHDPHPEETASYSATAIPATGGDQ